MLKVLIISTIGLRLYGFTNNIMNYYRNMDKSDMQIDFVLPDKTPARLKNEINSNGGIVYDNILRKIHTLKYMKKLVYIIKNGSYNIVHVHGNSTTLAIELNIAKLCGVKVRIAHCHSSICDHRFVHRLLGPLFHRSYTNAFACSRKAGKWLYGEKPFTVINNGIETWRFLYNKKEREKCRKQLGFENNKVIGHIGHFSYYKNHEFLINLFSEIYKKDNSYRLLLVGDGDLRDTLQKLIMELGLSDVVCMFGETLNVSKLLQAMDVFVFPSRYEGLGIVVIEAQAAGLPCIVSKAVPREAKITPLLRHASLHDSINTWVERIMEIDCEDRESGSNKILELVQNSNFDIKKEAVKLKDIYYNAAFGK